MLALGTAIVFAVLGHWPDGNWYRLRHDIRTNPVCVWERVDVSYDTSRSRMENAIRLLTWVHDNIRYEGSNPLLPLPELISTGRGTCGVQAKIFGALCRIEGYPIRYVVLHSNGYLRYHSVVEVYVDDKWVLFDPQHNLVLYDDGVPLNAWELHSRARLAVAHPWGKELFENVLMFQDGDYFSITSRNWKWFY